MQNIFLLFVVVFSIAACGDQPTNESTMESTMESANAPEAATQTAPPASVYVDAVSHAGRSASDRERDAGRKPAEVLQFFGIAPGMTVLDMFAGGGYYTELVSHVVGPDGKVVSHTNEAYAQFVGEEADQRYLDNRLGNVEILMAENNELELPAATFDAVLMILAYHDIYYVAPNYGWPKIDGPKLLAEIYRGLKPGGVLGIVDHYAEAGAPRETGNTLHRIDPAVVIEELEAAGFEFVGRSDVLRNMDDDYSLSMSAPEVRGKTDRFVMKFRKPL